MSDIKSRAASIPPGELLSKVFGRKSYTLIDENRWIHDSLTGWDDFPPYMKHAYFSRLNDYICSLSGYTRHLKP